MEDVLTIVLLVLWGVFSLYRASRKKGQKTNARTRKTVSPSTPRKEENELTTILSELLGQKKEADIQTYPQDIEEEEVLEEQYQFRYEPVEDKTIQPEQTKEYFSYDNNLVDEEQNIDNKLKEYFEEHSPENEQEEASPISEKLIIDKEFFEEFDLKKAVIYSEILNRPYH